VALTAGLALLTFVKVYGIAFLARPRAPGAETAHESGRSMRAGMLVAAASVVLLGLAPGPVVSAAAAAAGLTGVRSTSGGGVDLVGVAALLHPVALTSMAGLLLTAVVLVVLRLAWRYPRRTGAAAWGGGGVRRSPRMQYTATSYAEPLARVFDDALRPERDIVVTHAGESRYLVERVQFRQRMGDVVETTVYLPGLRLADRLGIQARRLQNGSIHRYLLYSFVALLVVLIAVSV